MNVLSVGDVNVGDYVAVFEWQERVSYTDNISGKIVDELRTNENPSLQGVPLKVIDVNRPIIAVEVPFVMRGSWVTPILFFDLRKVKFFQSSEEFYNIYAKTMSNFYQKPKSQLREKKIKVQKIEG